MMWAGLCVLSSLLFGSLAAPTKPNFVLLFVDDWGYGDLGANWPAAAGRTPNMDKLANEGIRFTDFHVGASVCSVSRAALLTGRLGVRTGVVHNFGPTSIAGLPRTENTIAELLKPAGYRTATVGKWHLGTTPGYHPSYRGFDEYMGIPYSVDMGCTDNTTFDNTNCRRCGSGKPTPHEWRLPLPLYKGTTNCGGQGLTNASCNTDIWQAPVDFETLSDNYAKFADDFIMAAKTDSRPFLLYVPFSHIHTPQYVMPRNQNRSQLAGGAGHFYDTLMELDDTVGSIMSSITSAGVADNTLVLLTGDNGPWEVKCDLSGSPGPFLGLWQKNNGGGSSAKTTLWEGGHRMVGVAHWPTKIAARVSNATVSTLDYVPTLLSLAGVPLPTDRAYDGLDLTAVLLSGSEQGHDTLFHPNSGSSGENGKLDGVRLHNYKAIFQTGGAPDCSKNSGNVITHDPPLLFDLAADPAEEHALDVTKEPYKTELTKILAALKAQMHSVNSTFQSVVDYSLNTADEPCAHYPTTCRT